MTTQDEGAVPDGVLGALYRTLHQILDRMNHLDQSEDIKEILRAQHTTNLHLAHMERTMVDIQTAETDLAAAVNAAVAALGGGVQALKDQLAQAQNDLAALQVQDDADKAALAQSLTDSQAAADNIEGEVSALNAATGTTPTPPPAA